MSGTATSVTQALPLDLVSRMRRALEEDDIDVIGEYHNIRPMLYGGSRNNHLESCVQDLLEAFPHPGIAYLCKHPVVLDGETLARAIADLRRFIAFLGAEAEVCSEYFKRHFGTGKAEDIRDTIDRLPVPLEQAIAEFDGGDQDADNHHGLLSLLNAHAAVLEDAQAHGMAVMYCLWLYGG